MIITIANQWTHIGAIMLLPAYVLFIVSKKRFKQAGQEVREQRLGSTLLWFLRCIRWPLAFGIIALGIAMALVVGTHRLFVGVEVDETALTLHYTWPRSDVRLEWGEIVDARVETRKFGIRNIGRRRLAIITAEENYISPWCRNNDHEIPRAYDIVKTRVPKPLEAN